MRGHSGVSHDDVRRRRDTEPKPVRGQRTFIDAEVRAGEIGNSGCVRPSGFCRDSKSGNDFAFLLGRKGLPIIIKPK